MKVGSWERNDFEVTRSKGILRVYSILVEGSLTQSYENEACVKAKSLRRKTSVDPNLVTKIVMIVDCDFPI